MKILKINLVIVFLAILIFLSLNSYALEFNQPSSVICYNPWHYNEDDNMGACPLLFDGDTDTGYVWRESDTWVFLEYNMYMQDVSLNTVTDTVTNYTPIPEECLLTDGLRVNISNLRSFTCWNGADWVSFGRGLGGFQPNDFNEVSLEYTPMGVIPSYAQISPENGATDLSTSTWLLVDASDDEGNSIETIFYDGDNNIISCTQLETAGDRVRCLWSGIDYNTQYSWYVTVDNGVALLTSDTWTFTTGTNNPPYISNQNPVDAALEQAISIDLRVTAHDDNGNTIDVTFYGMGKGGTTPEFEQAVTGLQTGGVASVNWPNLEYNSSYEWYVVVDDGTAEITYGSWEFMTLVNEPATIQDTVRSTNRGSPGFRSEPLETAVTDETNETQEEAAEQPEEVDGGTARQEEPTEEVTEDDDSVVPSDDTSDGIFITGAAVLSDALRPYSGTIVGVIIILIVLYALSINYFKLLKVILRAILGIQKRRFYVRTRRFISILL